MWVLVLTITVVFLGIAVPILVSYYFTQEANEVQLEVTCTTLQANIDTLEALEAVSRTLGLPESFDIPELPAECHDLSS